MICVPYMIRKSMPASVDATRAVRHADFVRLALSKAPVHVRLAIFVLTLVFVPLSMVGLGGVVRKYIPLFNLLLRVYRSLVFLQLFEQGWCYAHSRPTE